MALFGCSLGQDPGDPNTGSPILPWSEPVKPGAEGKDDDDGLAKGKGTGGRAMKKRLSWTGSFSNKIMAATGGGDYVHADFS